MEYFTFEIFFSYVFLKNLVTYHTDDKWVILIIFHQKIGIKFVVTKKNSLQNFEVEKTIKATDLFRYF